MYILLLSFVCLSPFLVPIQEEDVKNQQQEQEKIPTTLGEAHAELERILPPQTLADIDAMPSEGCMIEYHMSLGLSIRNRWGLWGGSALAKHMQGLGFAHPDKMSDVILRTFWCKRHGQDLRLKERAAGDNDARRALQKPQEEEEKRVQKAKAAIRNMMMGLRLEKRDVPAVRIPISKGLNVRFLCPYRGGVFLAAYCQGRISSDLYCVSEGYYVDPDNNELHPKPEYDDFVLRGSYWVGGNRGHGEMKPGDDFYTQGFYVDLADRKIHRISVPEVNEVYAAVVAGDRAWFAGLTNGNPVLVGVGERDRIVMSLPQADEIPDLGMDDQSLLAVYPKKIFRLTDRQCTLVHSGDVLLPRSGLPPQLYGNEVFLRDEVERTGHGKRLWWLTLGEKLHLHALDHNVGVVGQSGPRWENSPSYCVTKSGDLWACVGDPNGMSLLRRSKEGNYSVAITNNSVQFTGDLLGSEKTNQGLTVSAVTALSDDSLLLAGNVGLYRFKGNELVQELAFAPEETTGSSGGVVPRRDWNPSTILVLDDRSYIIGTDSSNGICWLHKSEDGQWTCVPIDDAHDTVIW